MERMLLYAVEARIWSEPGAQSARAKIHIARSSFSEVIDAIEPALKSRWTVDRFQVLKVKYKGHVTVP